MHRGALEGTPRPARDRIGDQQRKHLKSVAFQKFFVFSVFTLCTYNTAVGYHALRYNSTGSNNIAIGYNAGTGAIGGTNSNNIIIGNAGGMSDSGAIRIGTTGFQSSFFAAGVSGVTTGVNDAVTVVIDSTGQLGTVSSSRRFKDDIHDMGEASRGLMRLRPVTFRYTRPHRTTMAVSPQKT